MTKHRIVYMDVDKIESAPHNAKGHDDDLIDASFTRFGYAESGLLDERTGLLVAGHGRRDRLRALKAEGVKPPKGVELRAGKWFMPVERGWSSVDDDDAIAAGIAFNHISEKGGWKPELLWADLSYLASTSPDALDALGFVMADVDLLRAQLDATPAAGDTPVPDADVIRPPDNPVSKPGDVWLLGEHRLICGDCRDLDVVRELVGDRQVNLAFTSPPYASQRAYDKSSGFTPIPEDEYVEWFAAVAANVCDVLADDGSWFVNIKPPADGLDTHLYVFDLVLAHVRAWGWHLATEFCWERSGVPKQATQRFKNQFEPIYQFARGRWKMRPDNVRHISENAIVPLGPGAGNASRNPDDGGTGGALGVRQGQGGATVDNERERGRATQLATLKPKARKAGTGHVGPTLDAQGTNWAPGEAVGLGLAYPGNRLPTFAGTHEATGHAAAFPVGLPAWFVRAYTDEGDVVFDPFAGSGSTILAAHGERRVGLGVELSPAYCDVICERYARHTSIVPTLERTGRAFKARRVKAG